MIWASVLSLLQAFAVRALWWWNSVMILYTLYILLTSVWNPILIGMPFRNCLLLLVLYKCLIFVLHYFLQFVFFHLMWEDTLLHMVKQWYIWKHIKLWKHIREEWNKVDLDQIRYVERWRTLLTGMSSRQKREIKVWESIKERYQTLLQRDFIWANIWVYIKYHIIIIN